MYKTIIKQLEKALECKDDELRIRVEVLVDMLKESDIPVTPRPAPSLPTYYSNQPTLDMNKVTVSNNPPKIKGPGAIISNGEQINYRRPPNT